MGDPWNSGILHLRVEECTGGNSLHLLDLKYWLQGPWKIFSVLQILLPFVRMMTSNELMTFFSCSRDIPTSNSPSILLALKTEIDFEKHLDALVKTNDQWISQDRCRKQRTIAWLFGLMHSKSAFSSSKLIKISRGYSIRNCNFDCFYAL